MNKKRINEIANQGKQDLDRQPNYSIPKCPRPEFPKSRGHRDPAKSESIRPYGNRSNSIGIMPGERYRLISEESKKMRQS